jgi:hypothetical protein
MLYKRKRDPEPELSRRRIPLLPGERDLTSTRRSGYLRISVIPH